MPDLFSVAQRQRIMRSIGSKDTRPELAVRHLVYALGFRYRLHVASLPGKPDIVFPGKRKIIFVNGCFWHRHTCKKGQSTPMSRRAFWVKKLEANRRRDNTIRCRLRQAGWRCLIIWECQIVPRRIASLEQRVKKFLSLN